MIKNINISKLTLKEISDKIDSGEITKEQVSEYFKNALTPILNDILEVSFEDLKSAFNNISNQFKTIFIEFVKYIKENSPDRVMFRNGWLITNYLMEIEQIKNLENSKLHNKELVNKLMVKLLTNNKYEKLEQMIVRWKGDIIFKEGYSNLYSSFLLLRNTKYANKKYNIPNILIPFLLIQIEYLNDECYKLYLKIWNEENNLKDLNKWNWIKHINFHDSEIAHYFIQKVLFGNTKNKKSLKERNKLFEEFNNKDSLAFLNRHLIIHAKTREYSSLENLLKMFLTIDLLFDISNQIQKNK
jgi:hypothetical protein